MAEVIYDVANCFVEGCPGQGKDNRVAYNYAMSEIAIGRSSKKMVAFLHQELVMLGDPENMPRPGAIIPAIRITKDTCGKCGQEYTIKIETGVVRFPLLTKASQTTSEGKFE